MGTRNRLSVARPCCGESTCQISDGWLCDVKNGIVSADVTGWSVDSGTWNATQTWATGTDADTLTTSSSSASISCDTAQSGPLDGRVRVMHYIKLTHTDDEAEVDLAGYTVVFKSSSVTIKDSGGSTVASSSYGISTGVYAATRVCTWYDSDTSTEYIGVYFAALGETGTCSNQYIVAEASVGADGTTAFGTGSVTGSVSFQHRSPNLGTDGRFFHNTTLDDSTDCITCLYRECPVCPGNDSPRYLTVEISGFTTAYGTTCDSGSCSDLNATYVFDMLADSDVWPCARAWRDEYTYLGGGGYPYWCPMWCDEEKSLGVTCYEEDKFGLPRVYDIAWNTYLAVYLVPNGTSGNWDVKVEIMEYATLPSLGIGDPSFSARTQQAIYAKSFTSADKCTAIDDDLTLESYTDDVLPYIIHGEPVGTLNGCDDYDSLTVHVTASE